MKKMMRTMIGCAAAFAAAMNSIPAAAAESAVHIGFYHKENTIDLCIDRVTADEAEQYTKMTAKQGKSRNAVQAGDYKVSVRIFNNTGMANTGFRLMFDIENFEPVVFYSTEANITKEHPVYLTGDGVFLGHHFSVNRYEDEPEINYGLIGWGTMAMDDCTANGEIYSFFFSPRAGVPESAVDHLILNAEVVDWKDSERDDVTVNLKLDGYYFREEAVLGDMDDNAEVDTADAMLLLDLTTAMMTKQEKLNNFDFDNTYEAVSGSGRVTNYDLSYLAATADVNRDGELDLADAQEVLSYYVQHTLTMVAYEGIVGNATNAYRFVKTAA